MPKFNVNARVKCLHCQTVVQLEFPESRAHVLQVVGRNEQLGATFVECPSCGRIIATIEKLIQKEGLGYVAVSEQVVWPLSSGRPPAPGEVPDSIRQDYDEAALVLPFSAKASAALSRRCLQAVLRDAGKTKGKHLSNQIREVLPALPTYIANNLDIIRNIGNFATHEQKSTSTGTILDVESGEAEWNLEVLDALFDFYYVKPAVEAAKRAELEKKLADAGKPPLKKP